jgi:thioredoxin 1
MSKALAVTKDNFDAEVLKSDSLVLVDFWASWCGPCMMLSPTIDALASELEGEVKVVKINVDEENELAAQYGVMSIPTIVFIKGGKEVAKSVGVKSKADLMAIIDANK